MRKGLVRTNVSHEGKIMDLIQCTIAVFVCLIKSLDAALHGWWVIWQLMFWHGMLTDCAEQGEQCNCLLDLRAECNTNLVALLALGPIQLSDSLRPTKTCLVQIHTCRYRELIA